MSDAGRAALAAGLRKCTTLTDVSFRNCALLSEDKMGSIADAVLHGGSVRTLQLQGNGCNDASCKAVCDAVRKDCPKLETLVLGEPRKTDGKIRKAGVTALCELLGDATCSLRALSVKRCNIGGKDLLRLIESAVASKTLRMIEFDGNKDETAGEDVVRRAISAGDLDELKPHWMSL